MCEDGVCQVTHETEFFHGHHYSISRGMVTGNIIHQCDEHLIQAYVPYIAMLRAVDKIRIECSACREEQDMEDFILGTYTEKE